MIYGNFFFPDWISSARVGKLSEHLEGVYFRLLCQQFQCGGYLPADKNQILMLTKRTTSMQDVEAILNEFFELNEIGYFNLKMLDTYFKAVNYSKSQTENGKLGGRPKKPTAFSEKTHGLSHGLSQTKAIHETMNPYNHEAIKPKTKKNKPPSPQRGSGVDLVKAILEKWNITMDICKQKNPEGYYGKWNGKAISPTVSKAIAKRIKHLYFLENWEEAMDYLPSDTWFLTDMKGKRDIIYFLRCGEKDTVKNILYRKALAISETKNKQPPTLPEIKKAQALWKEISGALENQIGKEDFKIWLSPAKPLGIKNKNTLVILLPNSTFVDWVSENYIKQIEKAACKYKIKLSTEEWIRKVGA